MKRIFLTILLLCWPASSAVAGVYIKASSGQLVAKTTLAVAVAAPEAVGKTIVVTSAIALAGNVTIPSTVAFRIENGGIITTTGYTLTINGPFSAPLSQVFTGTGTVTGLKQVAPIWWGTTEAAITSACAAGTSLLFSSPITLTNGTATAITLPIMNGREQIFSGTGVVKFTDATSWSSTTQKSAAKAVYPEWWGTGATALQTAAYSIAAQTAATTTPTYLGGRVLLAPKYYLITDTLIVPDHVWVETEGGGIRQGVIRASGSWTASHPVVQLGRVLETQYWSHDSRIRNCSIDSNYLANVGIYSASANEGSGVENVMVRNFLLKGVHFENTYTGSTSPRLMHSFIREVQAFAPVADPDHIASYPNPENVHGIEISSASGATSSTTPGTFTNFEISKCTVTAVGSQNDLAPILIGAGIYLNGIAGVNITDSHAEYAEADVVLGDDLPVRNIRLINFDGYSIDPITVQIGSHENTDSIVMENIYSNNAAINIQDLNTSRLVDIPDIFVARYTIGKIYDNSTYLSTNTSSNALNVSGAKTIGINSSSGTITIGGLANGHAGDVVNLVKITSGNSLVLKNNYSSGTQKILTNTGSDVTITNYGGAKLYFNGTYWIQF